MFCLDKKSSPVLMLRMVSIGPSFIADKKSCHIELVLHGSRHRRPDF